MSALILTKNQQVIFNRLKDTAELVFSKPEITGIPLQANSLLLGPTGCGKSTIAKRLANELGADYHQITYGTWIVHGNSRQPNTIESLMMNFAPRAGSQRNGGLQFIVYQ